MLSVSRLSSMLKSMANLILIVSILLTSQIFAQDVYMTVDEDGNKTFTDQASDDAEKVDVKEVITIPGLKNLVPISQKKPEVVDPYSQLLITYPKNDETYFRSEGRLIIQVQVVPNIRISDKIAYYLDGNLVQTGRSKTFGIDELDRGSHNLSVSILSADGNVIKSSEPVIFHMRQSTAGGG
ncbi:MAG: hypothetical protein ACI9XC_000374 [Gammaproteobacteria bacterium]